MEDMLKDALCCVGLFYLFLHVWHSLKSIRNAVAPSSSHQAESLPGRKQRLTGVPAELGADGRSAVPEESSHAGFDRF